jgi:hypothetical protein
MTNNELHFLRGIMQTAELGVFDEDGKIAET